MIAAGKEKSGFETIADAARAMAAVPDGKKRIVTPTLSHGEAYELLYKKYRRLAEHIVDSAEHSSPSHLRENRTR
jgi:L-ribulokinase